LTEEEIGSAGDHEDDEGEDEVADADEVKEKGEFGVGE